MQANGDFSFRCVENDGNKRVGRIARSGACGLGIHNVRGEEASDGLWE